MTFAVWVLMLVARTAHGQSSAPATPPAADGTGPDVWLTLGAGVGAVGSGSGSGRQALIASAAAHGQWGARTGSLRFNALGDLSGIETNELGVLVGRATTVSGPGFAAVSVGLSAVRRRECVKGCGLGPSDDPQFGPWRGGLGLSLAGDVALHSPGDGGVGLGLTTFANLNAVKSFVGVELNLLVGQWH